MRFLNYIYYRVYKWQLNLWGAKENPQYTAMFAVVALIEMNLLMIQFYLKKRFHTRSIAPFNLSTRAEMYIFYAIFLIVGYFVYIRNGAYKNVVYKMDHASSNRIAFLKIGLWVYVICFFAFCYLIKLEIGHKR